MTGRRSRWPIPSYALYGESGDDPDLLLMHCESIPERSACQDWKIAPHRHDALFQIFYLCAGAAELQLEDQRLDLRPPVLLTMPPLAVHGFRFSRDVQGWVLTLPDSVLHEVLQAAPRLIPQFAQPRLVCRPGDGASFAEIDPLFARVAAEFADDAPGRACALRATLALILVWAGRAVLSADPGEVRLSGRKLDHMRRFREAVERGFRNPRPVGDYARALGITATQLNRLCREMLGKTALEVVHDRMMLEAKRDLIYTTMTVNEIAYSLGFEDPAYFTRFFTQGRAAAEPLSRQPPARTPHEAAPGQPFGRLDG